MTPRVSFIDGTYVVQGEPGGNPKSCSATRAQAPAPATPATNSVSCHGAVSAILASLGGGNDTFSVAESVPASVSSIIDGGAGSDTLRGGEARHPLRGR